MTRILMVRHGRAAASFTDDLDPGLDELGQAQATAVAEALRQHLPLRLIASPLKRAYETALPLQVYQGGEIEIEPKVSEIPSPGLSLQERGPWLRGVMTGYWSEQADALKSWREAGKGPTPIIETAAGWLGLEAENIKTCKELAQALHDLR